MRSALAAFAALVIWAAAPAGAQQPPPPIADNSFLIEEAYNQERGIVQHISTLHLPRGGGWAYSFTQEWPLWGQTHQGSFTVPVSGGLGDIALNYRHQLGGEGVAWAPRLSVILPTGDETQGRGTGEVGFQVNLPVSALVAPSIVTHWNAGVTVTPGIDATVYNAGASVIWLARPTFNVMLEVVWAGGGTAGSGDVIVNPGVRWAHNVGRLQIVPGVAFPDGRDVFLYLSFEHPFR